MNIKKYYRKVLRGDFVYSDHLILDLDKKQMRKIVECNYDKDKLLTYQKVSRRKFTSLIEKYILKGFVLKTEDGAIDRLRKEEVLPALDLKVDLSTYADYCKVRVTKDKDYFSIARIQHAIDLFYQDEIPFFELLYWSEFFASAVMESLSYPLTKEDAYRYAVIKVLQDHMLLGREFTDDSQMKETIDQIMPSIDLLTRKYQKRNKK